MNARYNARENICKPNYSGEKIFHLSRVQQFKQLDCDDWIALRLD